MVALLGFGWATCHAQGKPPGLLDEITDEFERAAGVWESAISQAALKLFAVLATIEMVWTGILIALRGSGIQEFFAELIRRVLFIGFFLALLLNAHDWSRAIVNSFARTGVQAVQSAYGGSPSEGALSPNGHLKPSAVAAVGIRYSRRIANAAPSILSNPGGALFFGFAAMLVLAGFASIASRQVVVLAELYLILSAGILVLGFGGSRWTCDYATRYLRYCVSVGVKLMFVQLTVALALHFLEELLAARTQFSFNRAASVTMAIGVLVVLVWNVPAIAAGFLQGASVSDGKEAMVPTQLMSTAAGSMSSAVGSTGQALMAATRLAGAQMLTSASSPRASASNSGPSATSPSGPSLAHRFAGTMRTAASGAARDSAESTPPNNGTFGSALAKNLDVERRRIVDGQA